MPDNSDREGDAERDRLRTRPPAPGLANEPEGDASEQEDFLPAD
jgi:hypothetical protein